MKKGSIKFQVKKKVVSLWLSYWNVNKECMTTKWRKLPRNAPREGSIKETKRNKIWIHYETFLQLAKRAMKRKLYEERTNENLRNFNKLKTPIWKVAETRYTDEREENRGKLTGLQSHSQLRQKKKQTKGDRLNLWLPRMSRWFMSPVKDSEKMITNKKKTNKQ